jgi:hypothetical protein
MARRIESGEILDRTLHCTWERQLENHLSLISTLKWQKGALYIEDSVIIAQRLEQEWAYEDFEATILSSLPALLHSKYGA